MSLHMEGGIVSFDRALIAGLGMAIVCGLGVWPYGGPANALVGGLLFAALGWFFGKLIFGLTRQAAQEKHPVRVGLWRRLVQIEALRNMLGFGLLGFLSSLTSGLGIAYALVDAFVAGLLGWRFFGL